MFFFVEMLLKEMSDIKENYIHLEKLKSNRSITYIESIDTEKIYSHLVDMLLQEMELNSSHLLEFIDEFFASSNSSNFSNELADFVDN